MPNLHVATFRVDATVPLGHPMCGGWIKPATEIVTPLWALGVVLLGDEAPVVLCAVDWTGVLNDAHVLFREKLAAAAHTTPEWVAVQCVHQHNAPFVDTAAQKLVAAQEVNAPICDIPWFEKTVEKVAAAVKKACGETQRATQIAFGRGKVEKVAANRRVIDANGKLTAWRGSASKDERAKAFDDGTIDPWLRTVSFWNGDRKLAALHYYATHPMSYYGDGLVNADFVGLAREKRTAEERVPHIYFTGCAGNVAAGKYNDGAKETRAVLADRVYAGMVASEKEPERLPVAAWSWQTRPLLLPPRSDVSAEDLAKTVADGGKGAAFRNRAAMKLTYRRRVEAKVPIVLSSLHFDDKHCLLHLPGESFIEYQLDAHERKPNGFVATAAYGDGGPWYIPTAVSYPQGGYEPGVAFVDPESDAILRQEIAKLVTTPK